MCRWSWEEVVWEEEVVMGSGHEMRWLWEEVVMWEVVM